MRKRIAWAVLFLSPTVLLFPRVLAFWRSFLVRFYMPFIGSNAARFTYPIFGMLLLLLTGVLIARFNLRRLAAALLTVVWLLCVIWLPLYGVRKYETCSDYTSAELVGLCERLSDVTSECMCKPDDADIDFTFSDGRVKSARYPEFLKSAGIAGIYIPFTCEAIVSSLEPAFTIPFIARHELAHAQGLADEGQATIDAYAQCISSEDECVRYSGYAEALKYALNALFDVSESTARDMFDSLPSQLKTDLNSIGVFAKSKKAPFYVSGEYSDIVGGLIAANRRGVDVSCITPLNPTA